MRIHSIFLAAVVAWVAIADVNETVDLGYSRYQGLALGNGVSQWLGIRFAAPPLGDLRFRKAAAPLVNATLQIANQHGPICQQSPSTGVTGAEDCLFLDVYAPTDKSKSHPVYIFLQGGGFNSLSAPNQNGSSLVVAGDLDLVVVTFNYRVGVFGFIASEEVEANGDVNVGLHDQRAVFEWVQKYIHLFGGDPGHVTIGGESAGGASTDLHLTAYGGLDEGLFHAAAAESQSFGTQYTVPQSQYQYDALVSRTGCSLSSDTLACLRSLPFETICANNPNINTPGGGGGTPTYMWSNVIDGNFTRNFTYDAYAEGNFIKVPAIFGDCTNEGTIFTPLLTNTTEEMVSFLRNNFPYLDSNMTDNIQSLYPIGPQYQGAGAYFSAAALAYGEMRYNCPGIYISNANSDRGIASNWNYHWDVLDPRHAVDGFGVVHTQELASIWGTSSPPDSALIPAIQGYWTSFMRTKDPNTHRLRGSPVWQPWKAENQTRIHFQNGGLVSNEVPPEDQIDRCTYLNSIGATIQQ